MTLEALSSIKGAQSSEAVDRLFEQIKHAKVPADHTAVHVNKAVLVDSLRPDNIIHSSDLEKSLIIKNFPISKNGYLVVSKVIEE